MARYNEITSVYDGTLFYDAPDAPPLTPTVMAKIKLNLQKLTDAQLILKAKDIKTKLTGNAFFPTTTPTLVNYGVLITAAETALADSDAANATAKEKTLVKNLALDALRRGTTQLGTNIESLSGGAPEKILSTGIDIKASKTPVGIPAQVVNLAVTAGDHDGELNAQWDPVPGAKTYEIATSPDPVTLTSWTKFKSVTKSAVVLTDLTSGARLWVRVRAIGAAGEGNWSDPGTKIVP
jgi:hypothetical protein